MEENNTSNELKSEVRKHVCFENHCWKKCIAMVLASFLGGFLAFYFVADQIMHRHQMQMLMPPPHHFEKRMFDDVERMHHKFQRDMDRMYQDDIDAFKEAFKINKNFKNKIFEEINKPMFIMDSVKIKTEFDDNIFKVIVCLKPFQGDENKINYNVVGRKLTVYGKSQNQDKGYKQDISFSQDFILPENVDTAKISKIKDGNKLIISVPMKE